MAARQKLKFFASYRREKNAKKISIIEKKGIVTSVKISLCVALSSYSCLWKDRGTVTPRKMRSTKRYKPLIGHKKKKRRRKKISTYEALRC